MLELLKIILVHQVVANILPPAVDYQQRELAKFASNVYHNFCQYCGMSLIIDDERDITGHLFLAEISKTELNMSYAMLTTDIHKIQGNNIEDKADIIFLFLSQENCDNIEILLKKFDDFPYWIKSSKIVLIISGLTSKNVKWIQDRFKTFWNTMILRVFICFWFDNQINVFTFDPFVNNFAQDQSNVSTTKLNAYLEHELINLQGYPLKLYAYDGLGYNQRITKDYRGLDGIFLTEVRNVLNVNLNLTRESQSLAMETYFIKHNNSTSGAPRLLLEEHHFDIFFTALRAKIYANVDYLFLHERDDLCLIVPKALAIPQYLYIFLIVPVEMWLASMLSLAIVSLTLFCILKKANGPLEAYGILISAPLDKFSEQKRTLKDRLVYASWLVFALIFGTVFQCTLTSTLTADKYYPDIDTMEDLSKVNLKIKTSIFERVILTEYLQDENKDLLNRLEVSVHLWSVKKMLANNEISGFLVKTELARAFVNVAVSASDRRPLYHIMRDHPVPLAQGYSMLRGHPYTSKMLWIINKVHESGLYWYWRNNDFGINQKASLLHKPIDGDTSGGSGAVVKLSVAHLQSSFYLLMLGLFLASCVFCFEVVLAKRAATEPSFTYLL